MNSEDDVDMDFDMFCAKVFMDGYKNALFNLIEGANAMMKDITIEKIVQIVNLKKERENERTH